MSLAAYHKKRHFNQTPEPKGAAVPARDSERNFVVQKHDASRLHYDFRLELDGVLKSWAVPKGPSLDPSKKVLAVQVEDHPIDYQDFEGVIPKGQYGGGTVLLWDKGTWEPLHDPRQGLASGKLHFILHGQKLKGEWSLVQMHGKFGADGKNWLLMKLKDKFAKTGGDVLKDEPKSVKTARSIDEIAGARDEVWSDAAKETAAIPEATKSALPDHFSPQLAVLAATPPSGDQWVHEVKFDGYRILARIKAGKVELITRNGKNWTAKFPAVATALAKIKADSAIIDGEMVVLDKQGRSDFQALQEVLKNKTGPTPVYYAFDLPFCNGFDLRESPLIERKSQLEQILKQSHLAPRINFSDHMEGSGKAVVEKACGMGLEGIVSKLKNSPYVSRRDPSWLKSKCVQRQELIIIGYTDPEGARTGFGSLLLGYHDQKGQLVYAGRVGTGFDEKLLKDTLAALKKLEQKDPPTDVPPPPRERRAAHWVKPTLVAEVKFTGWTRDGVLRHPAFVAFRTDKPAEQIVREIPIKPAKVKAITKSRSTARPRSAKAASREKETESPEITKSNSKSETIAGVTITHPDKVLYPDSGTAKRDIVEYYAAAERWMLPYVVHRPLALVRCPSGISSKCFFQRNWSETLPDSIDKVDVSTGRQQEFHVGVHDLAGIISLAQLGVLEIHTWNCRGDAVENPDQLIFDLDPGPDVNWKQIVAGAKAVRKTLDSLHLPAFLKTTGGKGLHITIPVEPTIDWDSAKSFTQTIAQSLAKSSDQFVANMRKDLRGGKIYLDYNRNGRSATAVAPYSTRARAGAPVSMPISWEDLGKLNSADHFKVETARRYLEKRKTDPWREFERSRVDLRKLIEKAGSLEENGHVASSVERGD